MRLWRPRHEGWWVVVVVGLHLALALWGAARNSVTFDENFHLPSGVLIVARHDFGVSPVNPPLIKALAALPALAVGARLPDTAAVATRNQWVVGESFMRRNADRYHRVFFASRVAIALLSCGLGVLVWRFARRLHGPAAGLLALGFYSFSAEALAHGGVMTLDVATGLMVTAALYAYWIFARTGRWRSWTILAVVVGLAGLTRFTTVLLAPLFVLLTLAGVWLGRIRRPGRVWAGIGLLTITTLAFLQAGYLGRTSFEPLSRCRFASASFQGLQRSAPWLRLPLPDDFVAGLDIQARESEYGTQTFLLNKVRMGLVWPYFPIAMACKWPLAFIAGLAIRAGPWCRRRRRFWHELTLLVPVAVMLLTGMFAVRLNAGLRYMFPMVPLLSIWLAGLADLRGSLPDGFARTARRWAIAAATLAALQAVEVAAAGPWFLAFYNRAVGGPGAGFWIVNDAHGDWGQGLIALREELQRRGIERVHLAYHGTTDPGIYGVRYIPYLGGQPSRDSDWIAVSSSYFVGLSQRITTSAGRTPFGITYDFGPLRNQLPEATPAHCMFLFRLR